MIEKRKVGIWLDYKNAQIIVDNSSEADVISIQSNVEDYNVKGGSSGKVPWGAVDTVSESKYLNRRKQQLSSFYDSIAKHLQDQDLLLIFGPAESKLKFKKHLSGYKKIHPEISSLQTVKYLTDNQKREFVRNHFKS